MKHEQLNVRWTAVDRVISFVSPHSAARRYAGKVAVANLKRSYDGAKKGRLQSGWSASGASADAEIAASGAILRDRMRDLVRNNSLAANATQVLVSSLVGAGIRPRSNTGDEKTDKIVDDLFLEWSKTCDAHGHTDFHGLVSLAVREMIEGGDSFLIKKPQRSSSGMSVPLKIELKEADHLDDGKWLSGAAGSRIDQGIEYNDAGNRTAFWMFRDHPGSSNRGFSRSAISERIKASNVAHLFERQRVQSRGVPWGAPAMQALRDLGDWQLAEMVRKKTEACLVGVVLGSDEEGGVGLNNGASITDSDGNAAESMEPGMLAYAAGGRDVKFNSPAHTGGVRDWNVVQMHIISAGFRVPYSLMTGDLKEANFASSRVGLNEFRRMITSTQFLTIIPMVCDKMWDWFTEAAFLAGKVSAPRIPVRWSPPRFESVNPKQDAETDLIETRAGWVSPQAQIAKRGGDFEDVVGEYVTANQRYDDDDLIFDSDPRRVSRAGLSQSVNEPGSGGEGGDDDGKAPKGEDGDDT